MRILFCWFTFWRIMQGVRMVSRFFPFWQDIFLINKYKPCTFKQHIWLISMLYDPKLVWVGIEMWFSFYRLNGNGWFPFIIIIHKGFPFCVNIMYTIPALHDILNIVNVWSITLRNCTVTSYISVNDLNNYHGRIWFFKN